MNFYPCDNNFTQALLVMLVTNIISVRRQQFYMTDVPMEPRRYSFSSNDLDQPARSTCQVNQPARSTSRRDSRARPRHFHGKKTKRRVEDPGRRLCLRRESDRRKWEKKRIERPVWDLQQAGLVEDVEILVVKEVEELVVDEWEKEEDKEEEVEMELQVMQEEKGELVKEEEFKVKEDGGHHNVRVPPEQIVLHNSCASRCDPFPPVEM